MFFKPNLTAMHLGFLNFMHGSLSENITAVHLGFSNFMYSSLPENLIAMHLGFSDIMQTWWKEKEKFVIFGAIAP